MWNTSKLQGMNLTKPVLNVLCVFSPRSGLSGLCQDWKWEDGRICAASAAETVRGPLWHLLSGSHSHQVSEKQLVSCNCCLVVL